MTDTSITYSLTLEQLQTLWQSMGYRMTLADDGGPVQLLSASQGIGFSVRPGNPSPVETNQFVDYTLGCALRVEDKAALAPDLIDLWHTQRRFARLTLQGDFLVLEMDVILLGGVTQSYLRATVELWDRVLRELVLFLRDHAPRAPHPAPLNEPVLESGD